MTKATNKIKPNRGPFVYLPLVPFLFISVVVLVILVLFFIIGLEKPILILPAILLFLIIGGIYYYNLSVRYRKEEYILRNNRVIMKGGGIFSDYETELVIKNITQVTMKLPFIEKKLFGTGSIEIKAAGSSASEIRFSNIEKTNDVYQKVSKTMEENGFNLSRDKLLQQEKPNLLGMAIYGISGLLGSLLVILLAFIDTAFIALISQVSFFIWILAIPLIFIIIVIIAAYFYMKIKMTTYYLYEDMIEYQELFLTKNYSFIPIENLANCDISQNFWQKILDLYNIKLSSQGSENDISFTMINNGKTMREHISHLIKTTGSLVQDRIGEKKEEESEVEVLEKQENQYTQELKITFIRKIIGSIIFAILVILAVFITAIITAVFYPDFAVSLVVLIPIAIYAIPAYIIYLFSQFIVVYCTKFNVNPDSVSQEFNFLTSKRKEFTIDKTTSIIIKENIIDRLFNTVTVIFTSIGSNQNVTFLHIQKDNEVIKNILLKNDIKEEKVLEKYQSNFSFRDMLKGNLFFSIFLILIHLGLLIASIFYLEFLIAFLLLLTLTILITLIRRKYYRYSKIFFFETYVFFQKGWLFKQQNYALYSNIKDLVSIKYPKSNKGRLTFNVAGENVLKNPSNQDGQVSVVPSGFTINYLDNVVDVHNEIDVLLYKYPFRTNKVLSSEPNFEKDLEVFKPVLANSLSTLILISIILFPLIITLPITIPSTIIILRRITYRIQPERIIKQEGVFFKQKTSVLHNRIDHITKHQGFIHKVFSNGSLAIFTVGSGSPELVIKNVKNHNNIYSKLEKFYGV